MKFFYPHLIFNKLRGVSIGEGLSAIHHLYMSTDDGSAVQPQNFGASLGRKSNTTIKPSKPNKCRLIIPTPSIMAWAKN